MPVFIDLLHSPESDVREQAVWALGNIAGDSTGLRDVVLKAGALPPLVPFLSYYVNLDQPTSRYT